MTSTAAQTLLSPAEMHFIACPKQKIEHHTKNESLSWRWENERHTYQLDQFRGDHARDDRQHGDDCFDSVTRHGDLFIVIAHEVEETFDFYLGVLIAEEQAEQDDLVEVILVDLLIPWRLYLEEIDAFEHFLHGFVTVIVKLKYIGNKVLIYHFCDDLISLAQFNHFLFTLVLQNVNNLLQRLPNFSHALSELIFNFIEPIQYSHQTWSGLNYF